MTKGLIRVKLTDIAELATICKELLANDISFVVNQSGAYWEIGLENE